MWKTTKLERGKGMEALQVIAIIITVISYGIAIGMVIHYKAQNKEYLALARHEHEERKELEKFIIESSIKSGVRYTKMGNVIHANFKG